MLRSVAWQSDMTKRLNSKDEEEGPGPCAGSEGTTAIHFHNQKNKERKK